MFADRTPSFFAAPLSLAMYSICMASLPYIIRFALVLLPLM